MPSLIATANLVNSWPGSLSYESTSSPSLWPFWSPERCFKAWFQYAISLLAILFWHPNTAQADNTSACAALKSNLRLANTTIVNATYIPAPANVPTPGSCQTYAYVSDPLCRVQFIVKTSPTSSVYAEAWLPDVWYGRFIGLGNGGVGGCIYYSDMQYTSNLHFAVVASDNGHDGYTGQYFLNNPEVINDFAFRATHVEAVIGKQIVEAYYGRPHDKAYFLGCSTGGRQGMQAALMFPEDFDGIVAGAPATDWNSLVGWSGMMERSVGAPHPNTSTSFIPPELWAVVAAEVLNQCDGLDGVVDGIITEPDECNFRPDVLKCRAGRTTGCLSEPQLAALAMAYRPLYDHDKLVYPRYDPGSEADGNAQALFGGTIDGPPAEWYRNAVLNDSSYDFSDFGLKHIALANKINPGGIAAFNGNLSAFRNRGGKFVTYHGRRDPSIPSGNSKRMYNLISRTLGMHTLDPFYRLFLIPGMNHCNSGPGAWAFGQSQGLNVVNASTHNVLWAVVEWVEGGAPPEEIVGTDWKVERRHCRYPMRSVWSGTEWACVK